MLNADNWAPVLTFHVFMANWQFGMQSACPDADFDLLDTLRMLRGSDAIEEEARPFYAKTEFYELIARPDHTEQ